MSRKLLFAATAGLALVLPIALASAGDTPTIVGAWARATAPGATVGAAYLMIEGGVQADKLVAATTERARSVEIHTVEHTDGVAKMRRLDAVEVPAGQSVELAPGGRHLMLFGLTSALAAGERFEMQLEFAKAGKRTVSVEVRQATSTTDHAHQHP